MMMTKEVGGKKVRMITDSTGYPVPVANVDKYDLLADREVRKVVKAFAAERGRLDQLMRKVIDAIKKLVEERGSGVADRGNMQFSTYDRLMRINVVTDYSMELDDRAKQAREMMMAVATKGLQDVKGFASKQVLMAFIGDAFEKNKKGFVRTGMVWRLLKLKVIDHDWQAACAMLLSSMNTHRSKSYVTVATRESYQSDWVTLRLEWSDCWPEGFDFNEYFADRETAASEEGWTQGAPVHNKKGE